MTKFYATSGSRTLTVSADSPRAAAMRLLDRALAPHAWIYDDEQLSERERRDHVALEALLQLESTVAVSERGVGRGDAGEFDVPGLLDAWHRSASGREQARP